MYASFIQPKGAFYKTEGLNMNKYIIVATTKNVSSAKAAKRFL